MTHRQATTTLLLTTLLAACSTGRNSPDRPPTDTNRSAPSLARGAAYHRIDGPDDSNQACRAVAADRLICRGDSPPNEGTYTLWGIPVTGPHHRPPTMRHLRPMPRPADTRPVVTVTRSQLRIDGERVLPLDQIPQSSDDDPRIPAFQKAFDRKMAGIMDQSPLLVVDRTVPASLIERIVYTAEIAGAPGAERASRNWKEGPIRRTPASMAVITGEANLLLDCDPFEPDEESLREQGSWWNCRTERIAPAGAPDAVRFIEVGSTPLTTASPADDTCDRRDVLHGFRASGDDVQACFEQAIKRHPDRIADAGRITVELNGTSTPAGEVTDLSLETSDDDYPDFYRCIESTIDSLDFPATDGRACKFDKEFIFEVGDG